MTAVTVEWGQTWPDLDGFVGYGATFFYGLAVAGQEDGNFLSINGADNGLHLVSALAGLAIALAGSRGATTTTSQRTSTGTTRR